jgi:hypothetical protein
LTVYRVCDQMFVIQGYSQPCSKASIRAHAHLDGGISLLEVALLEQLVAEWQARSRSGP